MLILLAGCHPLKFSQYSRFNQFNYTAEQPTFHFKNDSLFIEGTFYWATGARVIPDLSFIPKTPRGILENMAANKERVLLATWVPQRRKYLGTGDIPVTKADVRYTDQFNQPFYIAVLIKDIPFSGDTTQYIPMGRTNDYQFKLYGSRLRFVKDGYWEMQVIASQEKRYYHFVCLLDKSYMTNAEVQRTQGELFIDDIRHLFQSL